MRVQGYDYVAINGRSYSEAEAAIVALGGRRSVETSPLGSGDRRLVLVMSKLAAAADEAREIIQLLTEEEVCTLHGADMVTVAEDGNVWQCDVPMLARPVKRIGHARRRLVDRSTGPGSLCVPLETGPG